MTGQARNGRSFPLQTDAEDDEDGHKKQTAEEHYSDVWVAIQLDNF